MINSEKTSNEALGNNKNILRSLISTVQAGELISAIKSKAEASKHLGVKVGVAGLVVVGLAGCTTHAPDGDNTVWTPSPTESSAPTTNATPDFSPKGEIPSQYANLASANPTDLSEPDQLIYSSWLEQNAVAFDARYDRVFGGEATPLPTVSVNNTAVEIIALYNNDLRMAESFSKNGDGVTQDDDATTKELLALHDSPNEFMDKIVSGLEDNMLGDSKAMSVDQLSLANKYPDVSQSQITSEHLTTNSDGSKSMYINYVDNDGNKQYRVFNFKQSVDFNGTADAGDKWVRAN
ncbi:MAG: hypothetical protein ABIP50_00710 [Candidatus Saccharimonadales bacterium]